MLDPSELPALYVSAPDHDPVLLTGLDVLRECGAFQRPTLSEAEQLQRLADDEFDAFVAGGGE